MTPEQLSEIEARLRAATPGPWTKDPRGGGVVRGSTLIEFVRGSSYTQVALAVGLHEKEAGGQEENATFIANAPADIAALIAEVERLRRHLDGAQLSLQSVGAVRDHFEAEANEARAQLEAVTRERDRYRAALEHIVEHVQPGVAVNIAREALKGAG